MPKFLKYKLFSLTLCLNLVVFIKCSSIIDLNNFGPFTIKIAHAESCRGPKRVNCGEHIFAKKGDHIVTVNATMKTDMKPEFARIIFKGSKKHEYKMQLNNPCEHIFLKAIVAKTYHLNDTCVIKKGIYTDDLDIDEMAQAYNKGQFFYGNYEVKSVIYNKKCNLSCALVHLAFVPRKI